MRRQLATALIAALPLAGVAAPAAFSAPATKTPDVPGHLFGGAWPTGHVQGVAIDQKKGFAYYSFTQMLVKTDLEGNVIGTVQGLTGHLGDLDQNPADGRVYGSLEYKAEKAFYIAIFDVDKIDRVGMSAEKDGVMTTVHLQEVVDDFAADMDGNGVFDGDVADTPDHRYGSSGIDGVAFGPSYAAKLDKGTKGAKGTNRGKAGKKAPYTLMVAYGIYENNDRTDNDYQVLLEYDTRGWRKYEKPLTQTAPHRSGPASEDGKYFVYTGNTRYGVQNLEYDPYTNNWMLLVYKGSKPAFPNYSMFMISAAFKPETAQIVGQAKAEEGLVIPLVRGGQYHAASGVHGWESEGSFGFEALGGGYYYITLGKAVNEGGVRKQDANLHLHKWTGESPTPWRQVPHVG